MRFQKKEFLKYFLMGLFWILLSLRIYPSNLSKTLLESLKIFIGSGLYALGLTIIMNGLLFKLRKRYLSREQFIKWFLLIALLTVISASFEHYFRMK